MLDKTSEALTLIACDSKLCLYDTMKDQGNNLIIGYYAIFKEILIFYFSIVYKVGISNDLAELQQVAQTP